jgi:hypothetical protein
MSKSDIDKDRTGKMGNKSQHLVLQIIFSIDTALMPAKTTG